MTLFGACISDAAQSLSADSGTVPGTSIGMVRPSSATSLASSFTNGAYRDADGKGGLNGRILLMNNDTGANGVRCQGYADNDSSKDGYWEYANTGGALIYNLKAGTEFRYWTNVGSEKRLLWHLTDCRQGNTFPKSGTDRLSNAQNYLPWSPTSLRIDDKTGGSRKATRSTVGWCVMRNTDRAVIESSCFDAGIGTIYFDAVNGSTGMGEGDCQISVSIATNCTDHAGNSLPPTDENMTAATVNWHRLPMNVLKRDETDCFVHEGTSEVKSLCIRHGGTTNNFYRIYAPVDYRGPARFKIERVGRKRGVAADGDAMIVIDNIIASYPAMRVELEDYGIYDPKKSGKQVLGREAAWSVPFPGIGDQIFARARAKAYVNDGKKDADPSTFVCSAKMTYRWRYLNQDYGEWKEVTLDPANEFIALTPLKLPVVQGDVEYYYSLLLDAPYYGYYDYSGVGVGVAWSDGGSLTLREYSENCSFINYNCDGCNSFVRLRDGKSDYEGLQLVLRHGGKGADAMESVIDMELVGDHIWRGYLKTMTNEVEDIYYRIRFVNRQTPGATVWSENQDEYYTAVQGGKGEVVSDIVKRAVGEEDWSRMEIDATTGYLMFQVDDDSRSIAVTHADYQNFNGWNDANGRDFVGTSVDDDKKIGMSGRQRMYAENFTGWKSMDAEDDSWVFPVDPDLATIRRRSFIPFSSTTQNGWNAGPGMWVGKYYADEYKWSEDKGVAIQLEGQGRGFLQYTSNTKYFPAPRGIESVSFNARLGQFVDFNSFCYCDAGDKNLMTNYTFLSRVAFDLRKNLAFLGKASMSLAAFYHPGVGCYEARWEQIGGHWKKDGNGNWAEFTGPNLDDNNGEGGESKPIAQRLCLYRWRANSSGAMKETMLAAITNFDSNIYRIQCPGSLDDPMQPMFISVMADSDKTAVAVGIGRDGVMAHPVTFDLDTTICSNGFDGVYYEDTTDDRLTSGSYGVLSANCEGVFAGMAYNPVSVAKSKILETGTVEDAHYRFAKNILPSDATAVSCHRQLDDNGWVVIGGRMGYDGSASESGKKCLRAEPATQKLTISVAPAGISAWEDVAELTVDGFGQVGVQRNFRTMLYRPDAGAVRIAVGGSYDDARVDVVLDSVEIRQWRGADYRNLSSMNIPNWRDRSSAYNQTNFAFTCCWITNSAGGKTSGDGMLLMSAKRTSADPAFASCSIISPVFDGNAFYGRGVGLGMFSFSYRNAQPNVNLLLQVATNHLEDLRRIESEDSTGSDWITLTNFTFNAADVDLSAGSRSCYIGMHGVRGVMRLVMDSTLIEEVGRSDMTDVTKFGEIYITGVSCRDEPDLDGSSWWGWNMRTVGQDNSGADAERMMYLPDLTTDTEKVGQSAALNNSITDKVKACDIELYGHNRPFIQTPTFSAAIVGEVAFKARKYDTNGSQESAVVLYGSRDGLGGWERLKVFLVSNSVYSSFSYKTEPGKTYRAFRFCVDGVAGVTDAGEVQPSGCSVPARVLLDEILVSEAVRPRMSFRNVSVFRNRLSELNFVPGLPSREQQPLCREGWGVQCEVYASQLMDEIDFSRWPEVYLYYYAKDYPWGYENWGASVSPVRLPACVDSNLVFRSSYSGNWANTVVPMSEKSGIVQYMLEVVYWDKDGNRNSHLLDEGEWKRPDWYRPLDLNNEFGYGGGKAFAAYNILDTVAPGWAWINEANVFGEYDGGLNNSEKRAQFVEVVAPVEADLTGWSVRLIGASAGYETVIVTNTIGRFGWDDLPATKSFNSASNMAFHVIASKFSADYMGGCLDSSKREVDAIWDFENHSQLFKSDNEIFPIDAFGIQLVRPSGVVEHEVVCIGNEGDIDTRTSPDSVVSALNGNLKEARFFYVGQDAWTPGNSLGVFASSGETSDCWNNTMKMTPGRINENQVINPCHPTPNGESILVFANVDLAGGHVFQTVGDMVGTNASVTVYLERGSENGTNIVYRVDSWYELASVEQDGRVIEFVPVAGERNTYVAAVGKGASNNVFVTAFAKPLAKLVDCGLTPDNPYTPAVMDWMVKHRDAYGNDWADPYAAEVRLADYLSMDDEVITNMTLTEMYWLDMDPTVGNLALKGGIVDIKPPNADMNVEMSAYLMITNRLSGDAKTPYVVRGLAPGETSWDYDNSSWGWTSVTFKVTGRIVNGLTGEEVRHDWIPLRWFVFHEDSFVPRGTSGEGTSVVQLYDPYSSRSPGYTAGWYDWKEEYGEAPVYFSWAIDPRIQPVSVEVLKQENKYRKD